MINKKSKEILFVILSGHNSKRKSTTRRHFCRLPMLVLDSSLTELYSAVQTWVYGSTHIITTRKSVPTQVKRVWFPLSPHHRIAPTEKIPGFRLSRILPWTISLSAPSRSQTYNSMQGMLCSCSQHTPFSWMAPQYQLIYQWIERPPREVRVKGSTSVDDTLFSLFFLSVSSVSNKKVVCFSELVVPVLFRWERSRA